MTILLLELHKLFKQYSFCRAEQNFTVLFKKITASQSTMFSSPRKYLHGLTALRISIPATEPVWTLSSIAQTHWLWFFHANCVWSAFDLQNFVYAITTAAQSRGSGQNSGNSQFCLLMQPNQIDELLSTQDPAFVQCDGSDPHTPSDTPSSPGAKFPACLLYLHRIWSCHQAPKHPLLVGCERNQSACFAVLQVGQLSQPQEPCVPTGQAGLCCSVTKTLLQCHRVVPLHCTHSTELPYSMRNPAHHPPAFPFPHCAPFFELEGFLGVDCQIAAESCDLCSLGVLWRQRECEVSPPGCCTVSYLQMPRLVYSGFFRPLCTVMALETHT